MIDDDKTLFRQMTRNTILQLYYETGDPRYRSAFYYAFSGGFAIFFLGVSLVIAYMTDAPMERTANLIFWLSCLAGVCYGMSNLKRNSMSRALSYFACTAFIVSIWMLFR